MSAAGLPDLRPGPTGVDGDGEEALVRLGRPVDRHQQLLVVRRLQRPVMDTAAGPVPIQRIPGIRNRAFEDLEPADHRVLRAQLGQQRAPRVDPGAAHRGLQQRKRGTLQSEDGGVGLRLRVLDHRDLDAVAAVDVQRDQLQLGKIARQHETGQRLVAAHAEHPSSVDVVARDLLGPEIGDDRHVLDNRPAPQRQERDNQRSRRDQYPADPRPPPTCRCRGSWSW